MKCKCNRKIKKLKKTIEVLKKENEFLKKDTLLKDFNIFNRHYLNELLKKEYIPKLKNKSDWFYNIILIDLDNLHNINREKGYDKGDEYIISIIKKIRELMNKKNVSGRIFRMGGDEFLIIYQPYDCLNLNKIKGITYASGILSSKENFKDTLKKLDNEIIQKKKEKHLKRY